jgi:hypothetical protein
MICVLLASVGLELIHVRPAVLSAISLVIAPPAPVVAVVYSVNGLSADAGLAFAPMLTIYTVFAALCAIGLFGPVSRLLLSTEKSGPPSVAL